MKVFIETEDFSRTWEARLPTLPQVGLTLEIDGYHHKVLKVIKRFDSLSLDSGGRRLMESSEATRIIVSDGT